MIRARVLCLLALILASAAVLRIHKLTFASLWFDERGSVMLSAGHRTEWINMPLNRVIDPPDLFSAAHQAPLPAVWETADVHPPLYPALLREWRDLFGESDAAVRALSVLCSLAAILFLFDLARTLVDERSALWACAIMAVAQPQIEYAQEARNYALWTALALAASAAAARLVVRGPGWRRAIAMNFCVVAMILTHFFAVASAAALFIWCALYLRGRALRQALITGSVAVVILAAAAWLPVMHAVQSRNDISWLIEPASGHILASLGRLALIPARFLAEPRPGTEWAAGAAAILYFLPLLPHRKKPAFTWCGLWLLFGVGLVFALDLIRGTAGLSYVRFSLAAAPAVYLMIAALPLRNMLKDIVPALAIIGCLLALPDDYDATWKGQWHELGADLHRLAQPGDVVVFASPPNLFMADCIKLYEGVDYYSRPIPCPVLLADQTVDDATSLRLQQASHVWVVTPGPPGASADYLPGWHLSAAAPNRRFAGAVWRASVTIPP